MLHRLECDTLQAVPIDFQVVQASTGIQDELVLLRRKSASLDHKLSRLKDAYLSGADTVEEYKAAKEQLLKEQESTNAEISRLESGVRQEDTVAAMRERIRTALSILTSPTATIPDKFNAANNVIASCTWNKESAELKIIYRLIL